MRKFVILSVIITLFVFLKINLDNTKLNIDLSKNISKIKINNLQNLTEDYILRSINIKVGESFWNFNSEKLKKDLNKINEIENFNFQLNRNGVLNISINEKKPLMIWQKQDESIFLDGNANALDFPKNSFLNLTKINGPIEKEKLKKLNDSFKKYENLRSNVKEIFFLKNVGWKLILSDEKCLYLPEKNINKVLGIYKKIRHSRIYNDYRYFDMRIIKRIYLNKKNVCLNS